MPSDHSIVNEQKEKWISGFARFGIVSKGIVYCLTGILAAMASVGLRAQNPDKVDAFRTIYSQPFGKLILLSVAAGLLGYVTWRFFQAFWDIDHKGNDNRGKLVRIGYGISALVYLSIAILAAKLALGNGSGGGEGQSQQMMIGELLSHAWGKYVLGGVAIIIFMIGIRQIGKAVSGGFMENISLYNTRHYELYKRTGVAGYFARGLVWCILGYFFIRAAWNANEAEVQGTKGVFDFIENTFGSVLLGLVALGMVAYGVFMFVKARYQRIDLHF